MMKLKSLFRRGQGPASSSSSGSAGKQHSSAGSNNNRNKSQSTTSLNTAVESNDQQPPPATQFYATDPASERAVDVGDEQLQHTAAGAATVAAATSAALQSNTLPQPKKTKTTKTKGQKQPKQLPTITSKAQEQQEQQQQQQASAAGLQPTAVGNAAYVMTTIAGSTATATANHNSTAANNNYTAEAVVAQTPSAAAAAAAARAYQECNDLYKLNAAIAGSYQQYVSNNEQQQQQLLEANSKMQELQAQMERLLHEKLLLEARVAELLPYQHEVAKLKTELSHMQSHHEKSQMEISNLKYENESLRNRLHDVVNSPLSDAEKHQIIQDSQRLHSSAPASIALPSSINSTHSLTATTTTTAAGSEHNDVGTPCLTPDWDKHSSSSEISVACLQDKIIQMEETHYSTNEELQATLQELADLQSQLTDTQTENERLAEEKDVLFQSLCRQTEKLNESRTQITTLQELLLRDAKQAELGTSERENKLLELIKTSQEERETILLKQEELQGELQELRQSADTATTENTRFRERIALLDSTLDAANAERKQTEAQLLQAKEEISQRDIEINRLTTLLENARAKIDELEQDLARGEKTDLSELLDASRKEKDALDERVAELQDQCSRSQAEIRRLKDQLAGVTEECKVAKNNAKCALSHLEYRMEQLQQEKDKVSADCQQLAESTAELQVQCKCHLEDKTQLQNLLSETQQHLGDVERKMKETEEQLEKEIELRKQEAEEWQQFQSDLLMTVRVANDFKTEALSAREQLVIDNKTQKEKIRMLEQQIEKITKQQLQQNETQQSVLSTVQQEMASRRQKIGSINRQDSRLSVKTLIESIESNSQQPATKAEEPESHYSSTSSLNSVPPQTPETTPNIMMPALNAVGSNNNSTHEWTEHVRLPVVSSAQVISNTLNTNKGPLREQQQQQPQQQQTLVPNMHFNSLNNVSKPLLSGERKDPLNMLAKNGGSKRNALLKWCQNKTVGYRNIDITNFSSSWNDGLAFCAILHSYLPDRIPYDTLSPANKRRNFSLAFAAAESVGISTTLNINDMCQLERPDWTQVMTYVTAIYKHFET